MHLKYVPGPASGIAVTSTADKQAKAARATTVTVAIFCILEKLGNPKQGEEGTAELIIILTLPRKNAITFILFSKKCQ
jgi:hypothetical protein